MVNLFFPASGLIWPLAGIPLDGIGENLGVWNLAETPKYNIDNIAELVKITSSAGGGSVSEYTVRAVPQYTWIKNPTCTWNVSPTMEVVEYECYNGKMMSVCTISDSQGNIDRKSLFVNPGEVLYRDSANTVRAASNTYRVILNDDVFGQTVMARHVMPNKKTMGGTPAFDLATNYYPVKRNVAVKINTMIYPGQNKQMLSTKTFIPRQELRYRTSGRPYGWTLSELERKGYVGQ